MYRKRHEDEQKHTNSYTNIWIKTCHFKKKNFCAGNKRHSETEKAISGHSETLSDISRHLIQKKQAQNIKGGKKTKDHTKKKFSAINKCKSRMVLLIEPVYRYYLQFQRTMVTIICYQRFITNEGDAWIRIGLMLIRL